MTTAALTEVRVEVLAAVDPTTSWTATASVDLKHHVFVQFIFEASGTSPASYEAKLQTSPDDTTWTDEKANEVSAGADPGRTRIYTLTDEDGTVLSPAGDDRHPIEYERRAARYVRAMVKRTGGAGTDRIAVFTLVGEE